MLRDAVGRHHRFSLQHKWFAVGRNASESFGAHEGFWTWILPLATSHITRLSATWVQQQPGAGEPNPGQMLTIEDACNCTHFVYRFWIQLRTHFG